MIEVNLVITVSIVTNTVFEFLFPSGFAWGGEPPDFEDGHDHADSESSGIDALRAWLMESLPCAESPFRSSEQQTDPERRKSQIVDGLHAASLQQGCNKAPQESLGEDHSPLFVSGSEALGEAVGERRIAAADCSRSLSSCSPFLLSAVPEAAASGRPGTVLDIGVARLFQTTPVIVFRIGRGMDPVVPEVCRAAPRFWPLPYRRLLPPDDPVLDIGVARLFQTTPEIVFRIGRGMDPAVVKQISLSNHSCAADRVMNTAVVACVAVAVKTSTKAQQAPAILN